MSTNPPVRPTWTAPRPGRYLIDPEHSTVEVRTTHLFGLGAVKATFALRSGEVRVAETVEGSHVEAVVEANSFNSLNPGRDKRVRSKALLDSVAHPEINFESDGIANADGRWAARGTLTARGQAAPFELHIIDVTERDGDVTVVATGTVDRYAHGITTARGIAGRYLDVTISATSRRVA